MMRPSIMRPIGPGAERGVGRPGRGVVRCRHVFFYLRMPTTTFAKLGVNEWLVDALDSVAMKAPTDVQIGCISAILGGNDVVASARTGSGKTAAFAIPILQLLSEDPFGVFALVLTPTRELAFQIAEQFRILGTTIGLKQTVVVGGLDMMSQAIDLARKPHVVVATPGRLADHIASNPNAVHLKRLRFLVLDEADRLLTDNFATDLATIVDILPKQRQSLLFSATMTAEIESIQFNANKKPILVKCAERCGCGLI